MTDADSHATEKAALLGDRDAAIKVVSALRKYRDAVKQLLSRTYSDGFSDGSATTDLKSSAEDAEADLER